MFNVQCLILAASKSRISPEAAACAAQAHGAQQPHMQANACRTAGKEGKIAEDISRTLHRLSFDLPRSRHWRCSPTHFQLTHQAISAGQTH
eukprot:scaffold113018_cov18-Tisochrysis_lutea.AAC.1